MAAREAPFTTVRSEGGLLPPDLLARIAASDGLDGLDPEDYGLARGERLSEAIARAWEQARTYWTAWQASRTGPGGAGVSELREQWLLPLFKELNYGWLVFRRDAEEIDGRRFAISHRAGEGSDAPPVHTVAPNGGLDQAPRADGSGPHRSPHGLLQEYLNACLHLWGVVSDGLNLRLLRDNASLSRAAYVEADLEAMFREGVYADFVLLYLLLHRGRLPQPGQPVEEAWLEVWRREGESSGARAREALRQGVETALVAFGQGLLEHPANEELRHRLRTGQLSVEGYYRQLLRLVYRLIFPLAAEQNGLLFAADADSRQKRIYANYYAIDRLRALARRRSSDRHNDLWRRVQTVFRALRRVNYRDMDVEELGSVYEGLPEQQPRLQAAGERPVFALGLSGERKTTGSYYTNPGLIRELIRSALEPAIDAALARGATREERRRHLLTLKVCDPACGSGHFLLAAARRIGRALAEVEAEGDEPSPDKERAAVREAIGHCVYGVDLNRLAVALCRVALWLEGQNAGKPLQFLDHHLRHGNSLLGATAAAMAEGIPDAAFDPVTGDDKTYAATIRKRNRAERTGQRTLDEIGVHILDVTEEEARRRYFASLGASDETLREVARKELEFYRHQRDPEVLRRKLTADLWTAAFFWPLQPGEANPPTDGVWRRLATDPLLVDYLARRKTAELQGRADFRTAREAYRLARAHRFFHWELEFEDVFSRPDPGFDVILGNPPFVNAIEGGVAALC